MSLCLLLPGLPDMQIPRSVLASRQIILLGTINWDVLLKLNPIPHTEEFNTTGIKQKQSGRTSTPASKSSRSFIMNTTLPKKNACSIKSFIMTEYIIIDYLI